MLVTLILNGLMTAATLLLISLGMAIIFGIMNVVNLAHGELIVIGAYVGANVIAKTGAPFWVAAIAAFVVTGIIGAIIERLVIKKLYGKIAETLLVTYALSMIIQQALKLIFGPGYIHINVPTPGPVKIAGTIMPKYYVVIIIIAVVVFVATLLLFNETKLGMQIRAVSQNRQMAACLGVNTKLVDTVTFAFGAGLTGLAGCIIAPINSMSPFAGGNYMVNSFMSVVLGGVDSLFGTVLGSTIMGESNTLLGGYLDSVMAEIIVVFAVVVVIRFRPKGLIVKERR
ncbi:MAG: urea ABC transporter permease subunit UrtB [Wujia sp.]